MSNFVIQNLHLKTTQCWHHCGRILRFCQRVVEAWVDNWEQCYFSLFTVQLELFWFFPCRPLISVIKFCIIIICIMLMTVIGVVPLYWLNWSLYTTDCQILVFLMVACLHTTTCVTWFRILRCRNFFSSFFITLFALSSCTMYVLYDHS